MLPVAILAGGLATRLYPVTVSTPKSLIPVAGEPFVAHQLRRLRAEGVRRVVLCVGFLGEQIREAVGDGGQFGLECAYSFDGPVLRGTAGALENALPLLGEEFMVLYGDSYLPCAYAPVVAAFRAAGTLGLMTVFRNEGRWDRSNVEWDGASLRAYDKRMPTGRMQHIDYGLGVFRANAFERVPTDEPHDLATLYGSRLTEGQLAGYEVHERFYEIGSFEGIRELGALLGRTSERAQESA